MRSHAFADDVIAETATLPAGGCSHLLRDTCSLQGVTYSMAAITTCFRPPWPITHRHSSLLPLLRGPAEPTVAIQSVYNLQ